MSSALDYYQHLPLHLDPVAFAVGSFSVGWYALMYLVALGMIYGLLRYRIEKDLTREKLSRLYRPALDKTLVSITEFQDVLIDFLLASFLGALIGGRIGYVLLYNPLYYWYRPLEIISPYDFSSGQWIGIYGMSYHGGLLGVLAATWFFTQKRHLNFWRFADFVAPAIPAGYFFGRIGNFLNGELYGRVTDSWMGMYFSASPALLRFPSQLLEAFLEGGVIFVVLWTIRDRKWFAGQLVFLYLISYGAARFVGEFFRQPDEQLGFLLGYFTLGQVFSLLMIAGGVWLGYSQKSKKIV